MNYGSGTSPASTSVANWCAPSARPIHYARGLYQVTDAHMLHFNPIIQCTALDKRFIYETCQCSNTYALKQCIVYRWRGTALSFTMWRYLTACLCTDRVQRTVMNLVNIHDTKMTIKNCRTCSMFKQSDKAIKRTGIKRSFIFSKG